jgi:hypothetical protein
VPPPRVALTGRSPGSLPEGHCPARTREFLEVNRELDYDERQHPKLLLTKALRYKMISALVINYQFSGRNA